MIEPSSPTDLDPGWTVRQRSFDTARLHHQETVFTTGNGNLSVRGNLEEGYPGENAASFLHRVWDDMPVHTTELANLPRWWGIDLWLDGERVRLDRGQVLAFDRALDLRTGLVTRRMTWRAAETARRLQLTFERFVNLAQAHQAAVRLTVILLDGAADLRLRAGIDAHVENTGLLHWTLLDQWADTAGAGVLVQTRATRIKVAAAAALSSSAPTTVNSCDADGAPAVEHRLTLSADSPVQVTKFVAIVPELDADDPAAAARASVQAMAEEGWEATFKANTDAWQRVWADADITIEGDPEAQLAVRYNLFQLWIAGPRFTDDASIGAKTLSGYGYRHHVFWDTELFMLPPFTYVQPAIARTMLRYRWQRLAGARAKAAKNGYQGAQFPWESAGSGHEVTPAWVQDWVDPTRMARIWTGDIEIHITADIAYAVIQYWEATGDDAFLRDYGAEIILDGANFWVSAAQIGDDGALHYPQVIGPDEYHEKVDDNAFTNYLAAWHLLTAGEVLSWLRSFDPVKAAQLTASLGITPLREEQWGQAADEMFLPMDAETGLIEQFAGYFDLADADLRVLRDPARDRSMQYLLGLDGGAASQVIKQPDVLMLLYLLPELFTDEQLAANYAFYDPRTDHEQGSSLGPAISAVIACRAGDAAQAYRHFLRAARADLLDVRGNAGDGIHGASAGGLWQAVVFGFAGLEFDESGWTVTPRLPASWTRLRFAFYHRGERHEVDLRRHGP